jgi:ATP-dependent 26S proteasome regulatory subunit
VTPQKNFVTLLRSRTALLWVVTGEERRVERALCAAALEAFQGPDRYELRLWDVATGATDQNGDTTDDNVPTPSALTDRIRQRKAREIWILRDYDALLREPFEQRDLKSLARELEEEPSVDRFAAVVIITPSREVPPSLVSSVTVVDWPLPDRQEIGGVIRQMARVNEIALTEEEAYRLTEAAAGLQSKDLVDALTFALASTGRLDPDEVRRQKKAIIAREGHLEWHDPDPRGLDSIGGLDLLKEWLAERELALSPEARAYGLPAPRGLLIAGVPGCGKSALAKAIPAAWGLPLLRLDLGSLKGSLMGQSENNLRAALKLAAAVAPAVLWIDEIEKALAGSESKGDGGVAADYLGTILSWLQDRPAPVFVVATGNHVWNLPAALTREGRFDATFFVNLPNLQERAAILAATLGKFGVTADSIDLALVAAASEEFSGAEVAGLVPNGMFRSFRDGARLLATEDLLHTARAVAPMARTNKEEIARYHAWAAAAGVRHASAPTAPSAKPRTEPDSRMVVRQ